MAADVERELEILCRYLTYPNMDSYRVDPLRCAPIPGSFQPRITHSQAVLALAAIQRSFRVTDGENPTSDPPA